VAIDRAAATWGEAIFLSYQLVQRVPERLGHPFASDPWDLSIHQLDVNDRHSFRASEIEYLSSLRNHVPGVISFAAIVATSMSR